MAKCRQCPREVADNGYCAFHGDRDRLLREWAEKEAREAERTGEHKYVPKGQAVPTGAGLSRFGPPKKRLLSRAESEKLRNARRAALLEAQPEKGSSSKIEGKKKGGKKSGKRAR